MSRRTTRRTFNKNRAALAAAPLVAAAPAGAAQPQQPPETFKTVAQALTEVVRLRHGKHLSEEQLARIRQRIEVQARTGALLRGLALRNADEPDFVFFAEIV
jgi:hypothetical protein